MKIQYLEIVTRKWTGLAAYAAAHNAQFGEPDAARNARTAALPAVDRGAGPLRETEQPVVRPIGWWTISMRLPRRFELWRGRPSADGDPRHGKFAIYLQGGNDHGLWQL
jgi:hypothetical protein